MDWIVVAKFDECAEERSYELQGKRPPYSIGDFVDTCKCGGKFIFTDINAVG